MLDLNSFHSTYADNFAHFSGVSSFIPMKIVHHRNDKHIHLNAESNFINCNVLLRVWFLWTYLIVRIEQLFLSSIDLTNICQNFQRWKLQMFHFFFAHFISFVFFLVEKRYECNNCFHFMNEFCHHRLIHFHSHDK